MPVAVLSALEAEIEFLVEALEDPTTDTIASWPMWVGKISGVDVILARAGLGKVNTAALAAVLWERHRPSPMIFTGVAGGLDPSLGIGDLIIAERTIQHDAGLIRPNGLQRYQPGHVPFFNPTDRFGYEPSAALLGIARSAATDLELSPVFGRIPRWTLGTILTGDQFLDDEVTRDILFSELSAQAIEMEGAALGQVAERLGVDHLVIRSLSDRAGEDAIEDFGQFVPDVAANSARLVLEILRRIQEDDRDLTIGS